MRANIGATAGCGKIARAKLSFGTIFPSSFGAEISRLPWEAVAMCEPPSRATGGTPCCPIPAPGCAVRAGSRRPKPLKNGAVKPLRTLHPPVSRPVSRPWHTTITPVARRVGGRQPYQTLEEGHSKSHSHETPPWCTEEEGAFHAFTAALGLPDITPSHRLDGLCGKRHDNVRQDIKKMLALLEEDDLKFQGIYVAPAYRKKMLDGFGLEAERATEDLRRPRAEQAGPLLQAAYFFAVLTLALSLRLGLPGRTGQPLEKIGRSGVILNTHLLVPNEVRYQAALHLRRRESPVYTCHGAARRHGVERLFRS